MQDPDKVDLLICARLLQNALLFGNKHYVIAENAGVQESAEEVRTTDEWEQHQMVYSNFDAK